MRPLANEIGSTLPALRRYACALTGDQRTGDWYVRVALEALLEEPSRISPNGDERFQLYKLLGEVLTIDGPASFNVPSDADADRAESTDSLKRRVTDLPILTRHLLLLVTLEGFSVRRAAELFGIPESEAEAHLLWARRQLRDCERAPIATSANARLDYPVYRYSSSSRPRTNASVV